ncbi:hypothetical protein J3L11_15165 [Shewanella sp. 4t3-1-2LB]|uniref:hypothetical protein n=1 Tax=Shewanella sp. 4t3-1-2LB TaxID=2817682 RepID=UPI001A98C1A4|nr:hypothetical protein [Shewanella sp. 4t3-1-2LB]MBO1272986.1 hypothetical protein [Shewanella sp. 4t3-1-2LB]
MSVFQIYKKDEHLQRAKGLLNSDNPAKHVYACLELRFCIEAIVYQKLLHGIDSLPNTIVETWRPNKALKMLVEFDNLTASDCTVEVNLPNSLELPKSNWMLLGEQKLPSVRWLDKTYHKLGNFLHLVEPKNAANAKSKNTKEEVRDIAEQLEEYVRNNFLVSFNNIDIKQCPVCKQDIAFSLQKARDGETHRCSNRECRATFTVKVDNSNKNITLNCNTYDVKCQRCNSDIVVSEFTVRNLEIFSCRACGAKYIPKGKYEFALLPES